MSLSCQISCFPPDCIKENICQLALGELLVQKKLRQRTSNSLIFYIVPSNGTRHLSISHLRWLFYLFFFHWQIDVTPTAFFLLPSAAGNPRSPSGKPSISHSSPSSQVPPWAGLKSKGCANPRAVSSGCPAIPLLFPNPLKHAWQPLFVWQ